MARCTFLTPKQVRRLFGKVALEIYVATEKADDAAQAYLDETGDDPRGNPHFQTYDNKWGRQHRVYFCADDSNMEELDRRYDVQENDVAYLSAYTHKINEPALFWSLVSAGCRLGHNPP